MAGEGPVNIQGDVDQHQQTVSHEQVSVGSYFCGLLYAVDFTGFIVKLREREGQRVDLGRSLKGHL